MIDHEPIKCVGHSGEPHWLLDIRAVNAEMASRDLRQWRVHFVDVEPDLDAFARSYAGRLERHPVTGGYGRWLNPLGRWDWWDLGGRFDGRILGERRRPGVLRTGSVSSGPDRGRTVLANVTGVLADAVGSGLVEDVVVEADANIEMVSRLVEDARVGRSNAFRGAVLLPPGSVPSAPFSGSLSALPSSSPPSPPVRSSPTCSAAARSA